MRVLTVSVDFRLICDCEVLMFGRNKLLNSSITHVILAKRYDIILLRLYNVRYGYI